MSKVIVSLSLIVMIFLICSFCFKDTLFTVKQISTSFSFTSQDTERTNFVEQNYKNLINPIKDTQDPFTSVRKNGDYELKATKQIQFFSTITLEDYEVKTYRLGSGDFIIAGSDFSKYIFYQIFDNEGNIQIQVINNNISKPIDYFTIIPQSEYFLLFYRFNEGDDKSVMMKKIDNKGHALTEEIFIKNDSWNTVSISQFVDGFYALSWDKSTQEDYWTTWIQKFKEDGKLVGNYSQIDSSVMQEMKPQLFYINDSGVEIVYLQHLDEQSY